MSSARKGELGRERVADQQTACASALSVLQLLTQLSKSGSAPSSCGPTLHQLLHSNLPAKWWVLGRLDPPDVLRDCEFFDAGLVWLQHTHLTQHNPPPPPPPPPPPQALSSSTPFTPLPVLLSRPLLMNKPVLTANLLARPAPPPPAEDTPTTQPLEASQSQSRTKSRMNSKRYIVQMFDHCTIAACSAASDEVCVVWCVMRCV